MWKCPECNEEIDEIHYEVNTSGWENGTASLSDENEDDSSDRALDHDYSDSGQEWDGDHQYQCPKCDVDIELRNLIWIEEETPQPQPVPIPPEELEETQHNIVSPEAQIISSESPQSLESGIICKRCWHHFPIDEDDDEGDCPECGMLNTYNEFEQLLGEGFYNKKNHDL